MSAKRSEKATTQGTLDAERCVVELQRGREIKILAETTISTVALVETLDQWALDQISSAGPCQLIISSSRANALEHLSNDDAVVIDLPPMPTLAQVHALAGLTTPSEHLDHSPKWQARPSASATAALCLAQQAHVLPALIHYAEPVSNTSVLGVTVEDACRYAKAGGVLIELSRARIPLATAEIVELVVFKEAHGSAEHVAITVGTPDLQGTVVVRLHSSCFTGDILGSLRCDCGEQLQGAIESMANAGGGVVLYVSQEGRGIGLASKLRAYQLQDEGLDTIEANQHLGFDADERQYVAASTMLNALNINRVRLMTNNPLKIDALRKEGINIVGRLPSKATINVHNARYLETKRDRAGHLSMETVQ